jgi:acyl-CoA synthetase (AMP-forming)/AMP-acid ligase II
LTSNTTRTPRSGQPRAGGVHVRDLQHHHVTGVAAAPVQVPADRGVGAVRGEHLQEAVPDGQDRVAQAEPVHAGIPVRLRCTQSLAESREQWFEVAGDHDRLPDPRKQHASSKPARSVLTSHRRADHSDEMYPGTHAQQAPDRPAVIAAEDGTVLTYRDLDDASMRLAQLLYASGLRPEQHIAFLSTNRLEVFGIYWAGLRSGLFVTAVNHHLSPAEVAYIINDCGAEVLLVSADLADLAVAIADDIPQVRRRLAFGGPVPGYESYSDAVAAMPAERLAYEPRGADMLYSSGTTGRPKGIRPHPTGRLVDDPENPYAQLFGAIYSFDKNTRYYSPGPIYHAAPLRFSAFVHALGGTVVMARQFDAEAALAAIQRHRATHSQWVPTMFVRMLKLPPEVRDRYDVSSMKVAVHAAAPCSVEVKRAMMDWWGPVLHEYYSSTEGNGVSFIGPQEWLASRVGRQGRARHDPHLRRQPAPSSPLDRPVSSTSSGTSSRSRTTTTTSAPRPPAIPSTSCGRPRATSATSTRTATSS